MNKHKRPSAPSAAIMPSSPLQSGFGCDTVVIHSLREVCAASFPRGAGSPNLAYSRPRFRAALDTFPEIIPLPDSPSQKVASGAFAPRTRGGLDGISNILKAFLEIRRPRRDNLSH